MRRTISVILFLALTLSAWAGEPARLYQAGSLDELMRGGYSGVLSLGQLKSQGDFGLGTFEALDGEMVMSGGQVYQVKASGAVEMPPDSLATPFACVTFFQPALEFEVKDVGSLDDLQDLIVSRLPSKEIYYAVRLSGRFTKLTARSVPAQVPPYPPLAEVAKAQSVFNFSQSNGDLVGFWCPKYAAGLNLPGFHLHYLSQDKKSGGHLLACQVISGQVEIMPLSHYVVDLPGPDAPAPGEAQVTQDEVRRVEGGK